VSPRVDLTCPLCGTAIARGREPRSGEACPGCGATVAGGGGDPVAGVEKALEQLGHEGRSARDLVTALFSIAPNDPYASLVGITSDERDGFYGWWVLVREDEGDVLDALTEGRPPPG
jgi:hypothetical protein